MISNEEPAARRLHLVLPSVFESVERAVEETQSFMESATDDEGFAYRIVLLTSEAVMNAIEHGNGYDASKRVHLDLRVFADRVEMVVQDEGDGFDPAAQPDPLAEAHLLTPGGRGLFLMEEMADELRWEDNGCRLCLTLHRAS